MKKFFKKIAFVSAMATVVSTMPAQSAAAAEGPQMSKWVGFYLGGDASGTYSDEAKYAKVWNWKDDYVSVSFESSNPEVATVTAKKGKITPLSVGTTTITATFTDADGETVPRTCKVTVKRNAVDAGISDTSAEKLQNLVIGETYQPRVFRTTSDGVNTWKGKTVITDGIRCESTAPDVFTVAASTAKVTAVEEGEGVLRLWAVQTEKPVVVNEETKETAYRPTTDVVEYKVVVKSAGILEAEQTSFTELKLTLDSAKVAANMKAEDLALTYVVGEKEETVEIASVAVAEEGSKSVIVTLKSELLAKQDYVLTYGEQKVEFTTVASKGIVAAKQTAADTVVLTADTEKDATAMASSIDAVKVTYLLGTNEMTAFVESVKVDDNNKKNVIVTLFSNLTKDTTYTFVYGESKGTVVGVDLTAAHHIKIVTDKALKGELTEVKVDLYDVNDVKIGSNVTATIEALDVDSVDYFVSSPQIYFGEAGKQAKVKATYDMGYDSLGNKITNLTAEGVIVSYKNADDTAGTMSWALKNNASEKASGLTYGATVNKIAVNDQNITLYGKYTVTKYDGTKNDKFTRSSEVTEVESLTWKYTSTNNAVVMVDGDARLYPVGAGTAQIIVEKSWDAGANYTVAGVCTITVVPERTLTTFDAAVKGSNKVSGSVVGDKVIVTVESKDQLGDAKAVNYYVELLDSPTGVTLQLNGAAIPTATTVVTPKSAGAESDWKPYFEFTTTAATNKAETVRVKIVSKQVGKEHIYKEDVVVLQVKNGAATQASVEVSTGKDKIDMNLNQKDATIDTYTANFSAVLRDTQGFKVADQGLLIGPVTGLVIEENEGKYFATVTKAGDNEGTTAVTSFAAVKEDPSNTFEKTAQKATYVVRFYKVIKTADATATAPATYNKSLVAVKSIVVTDSTKDVTVKQLDNKIKLEDYSADDDAAIAAKLEFYRDGAKLGADKISSVTATVVTAGTTNTIFVQKVTVTENVKANNNAGTTSYDVDVNKVFNIVTQ